MHLVILQHRLINRLFEYIKLSFQTGTDRIDFPSFDRYPSETNSLKFDEPVADRVADEWRR